MAIAATVEKGTDEQSEALAVLAKRLASHSLLDIDDRKAVVDLPFSILRMRARTDVSNDCAPVQAVCVVLSGPVARYAQLADGARQIVSLHLPGDLIDLTSAVLPQPVYPVTALGDTMLACVPHAAVRELSKGHPNVATALWRDTLIAANVAAQAMTSLGHRDAYCRLAHLFCEIAVRYAAIDMVYGARFPLPITQEHLGEVTGLTAVHVNRMLKILRHDRLMLLRGGHADILDWRGLMATAGFNSAYLCLADKDVAHNLGGNASVAA